MHERKQDSAASIAAFTDERLIHFSIEARRLEGELWLGCAQPFRSRRAASSAL